MLYLEKLTLFCPSSLSNYPILVV